MTQTFEEIDEHLAAWIERQRMFFVGTAPLGADAHVNVSPKGPMGTLAILGPREVAYLDFFGSGAETVAHLRENGRIVVVLCAFEGSPRIVRLFGTGRPVWPGEPEFRELLERGAFSGLSTVDEARRAVVVIDVERVTTSCGSDLPLMEHEGEREHFELSKHKRLRTLGPEGLTEYQRTRNASSIDGLPAVPPTAQTPDSCC